MKDEIIDDGCLDIEARIRGKCWQFAIVELLWEREEGEYAAWWMVKDAKDINCCSSCCICQTIYDGEENSIEEAEDESAFWG